MCSGCRIPGTPAAATTIVGALRVARPVRHAGVHDGDRRVRGRALLRQQDARAAGRAWCRARGCTTSRPGDRDLVVREQRLDARGRARHRARASTEREPADVHRVQAVDVLVGVDLEQRGVEVDLRRRRVLHEVAVDAPGRR